MDAISPSLLRRIILIRADLVITEARPTPERLEVLHELEALVRPGVRERFGLTDGPDPIAVPFVISDDVDGGVIERALRLAPGVPKVDLWTAEALAEGQAAIEIDDGAREIALRTVYFSASELTAGIDQFHEGGLRVDPIDR